MRKIIHKFRIREIVKDLDEWTYEVWGLVGSWPNRHWLYLDSAKTLCEAKTLMHREANYPYTRRVYKYDGHGEEIGEAY